MTFIKIDAPDGIECRIERDDEDGSVSFAIVYDGGRVRFGLGDSSEDAELLRDRLQVATAAADAIVETWVERPNDEGDAFVTHDSGRFYVRLEGVERDGQGFLSREIAVIELAQMMVEKGAFPAVWFQDWTYTEEIEDQVLRYHDDGGTNMVPLVGVQYERGDEVMVRHRYQTGPMTWEHEWMHAEVIKDYGVAGVTYAFRHEPEDYLITDRADIKPYEVEEDDGSS